MIVGAVFCVALLVISMLTTFAICLKVGDIPLRILYYCAVGTITLVAPTVFIVIRSCGNLFSYSIYDDEGM